MMRMMTALILMLVAITTNAAWAQEPKITVTADQDEVVVGQPYLLRIEVLVPTFMPKAPVFPTFEMPGLIVRLPEKSTTPISEKIDGETWSGLRRTYRIYPTRAGETEISAQQLSIVYKNTDTNEDVPLTVDVPATLIRATVPPGARALDPLIIAQQITVDQTWQVEEGELAVGDAVGRTLEISVTGASALFVPPLLETALPHSKDAQPGDEGTDETAADTPLFLPYPEDAKVTENIERGVMSGTRHEQISYIAQAGGEAVFPDITLRWYNIETEEIEEIALEGRSVEVAMPPAVRAPLDTGAILRFMIVVACVALLVWAAYRFLWPPFQSKIHRLRAEYDATAHAAHRIAVAQAKAQNLTGLLVALDERTRRGCAPSDQLKQAIAALTQAIYRDGSASADVAKHWQVIQRAVQTGAPGVFAGDNNQGRDALPALNPFTSAAPETVYFHGLSKD